MFRDCLKITTFDRYHLRFSNIYKINERCNIRFNLFWKKFLLKLILFLIKLDELNFLIKLRAHN